MRSPHMGMDRERDRTYYDMLVNRLEFNNNQYVQGVLSREKAVCSAHFPLHKLCYQTVFHTAFQVLYNC